MRTLYGIAAGSRNKHISQNDWDASKRNKSPEVGLFLFPAFRINFDSPSRFTVDSTVSKRNAVKAAGIAKCCLADGEVLSEWEFHSHSMLENRAAAVRRRMESGHGADIFMKRFDCKTGEHVKQLGLSSQRKTVIRYALNTVQCTVCTECNT